MNEPVPSSNQKPPAPVPWIGRQQATAVKQDWSSDQPGGVFLAVNYRFDRVSCYRCQRRLVVLYAPHIGLYILGRFLLTILFIAALLFYRHQAFTMKLGSLVLLASAASSVMVEVFVMGMTLLSALFARLGATIFLGLKREFIFQAGTPSPCLLKWNKIARIVERNGDIYFLPKLFGGFPFAIPRSAFDDGDAAKRFYNAVVALWQSNGNADAVSVETLAEFALLRS